MKTLLVKDNATHTSSVALSVLRIDTNTNRSSSVNARLTDLIVDKVKEKAPKAAFSDRYLSQLSLETISEDFFEGICLQASKRTHKQTEALHTAEMLTSELLESDIIVFNVPVYPFGIQKSFKTYMEIILRCCQSRLIADDDIRTALAMKKVVLVTNDETETSINKEYNHSYSSSAQHLLSFLGIVRAEVYAINRNAKWNDRSARLLREQVAQQFSF